MNHSSHSVSILFCNNRTIQTLNRDFRQIDQPTDVLSFEDPSDATYLGDIAVSIPMILHQAEEFNVPFEEELKRMIIHGLLHLMGYHHEENEVDAQTMETLQENLIQEVKNKHLCYRSSSVS